MSTTVKAKTGDFKQVPAGIFPAICWAVIDIGHQDGPYGVKPQLVLCFEFPTETVIVDGQEKPMIMTEFYSATIGKKARLRSDLEGWRGRSFSEQELQGFELKNVLGKACTITTFENENGRTRIKAIGPAMKGQEYRQHNPSLWFDLDVHGVRSADFDKVPEWIREIIGKRVDASEPPRAQDDDPGFPDDDVPF